VTEVARYKDLCIDAADAPRLAAFWAAALGLGPVTDHGGPQLIGGPTPRHVVWVNPVDDPRVAKNRMHLDVHCRSIGELVALGASVRTVLPRWTVMADPDGGEFCAFVRADPPAYRLYELCLDAADPERLCRWWATVFGAETVEPGEAWFSCAVPGAPFEALVVAGVPEPKVGKNRVHIDVTVGDGGAAELVRRGATVLREPDDEISWTVLADPEGNELCAFLGAE
jgi:hypothetical protein